MIFIIYIRFFVFNFFSNFLESFLLLPETIKKFRRIKSVLKDEKHPILNYRCAIW